MLFRSVSQSRNLSDYMGIPININGLSFNSLWHRAYNLIWNEWFRDQNLQNSVNVPTGDGPDNLTDFVLLRRNKRADYFTTCLPWPQKGAAVTIPLGTSVQIKSPYSGAISAASVTRTDSLPATPLRLTGTGATDYLTADLSTATAATINSLRQAFQIQKLLERNARGGTRYTEILQNHFGVVSPDGRLQRPEYLGGSSTRINISTVAQTSPTSGANALGDLAAFGVAADRTPGWTIS